MSAVLIFRGQEYEVNANVPLREAIRQCGLSPEAVLPVKEGELLTDDQWVREGDVITLVAVISGG